MKQALLAVLAALFVTGNAAASGNAILIPAAGNVVSGSVVFRSDIAIHNLRSASQRVRLDWLPRSGTGQQTTSVTLTILSNGSAQSDDFVFGAISQTGLGAVIVQPVNADGSDDLDAKLLVSSRIWSPEPGADTTNIHGIVSQSFPPVTLSSIVNTRVAIAGARRDDQHRLNVGVVNLDRQSSHTFRIWINDFADTVHTITVEPYTLNQVALPGPPIGGRSRVMVEVEPAPTGGRLSLWTAYASVVNNISGDSWTSLGVNVTD